MALRQPQHTGGFNKKDEVAVLTMGKEIAAALQLCQTHDQQVRASYHDLSFIYHINTIASLLHQYWPQYDASTTTQQVRVSYHD